MELNVSKKIIEKLNGMSEESKNIKVSVVSDKNNNLQYFGCSHDKALRFVAGLFNNNVEEMYKHLKTFSLSEVIAGNNEVHINVVETY
jgi:hypothetical protein